METFTIEQMTFYYPGKQKPALSEIHLSISQGEFVTLCGKSGCGKSTLLRQLKTVLAPHGDRTGRILFEGTSLEEIDLRTQTAKIGFVLQNPDNQIVTDKVWHELAFGLESLGYDTPTIRLRVAEMASFFGIQTWFHKKVTELSGGQKQLLNLAAIMAMQPSALILDEPTSQLDPIAVSDFLETIQKINRELGTTILLTEHRLEEALPMSDRVIVMDKGKVIADGTPRQIGRILKEKENDMFLALPTPMKVYAGVPSSLECPVTVRDGREWLEETAKRKALDRTAIATEDLGVDAAGGAIPAIELSEIWFKYDREAPDVVKGLSAKIYEGEFYAIVGGNGTGKTTTISIMTGLLRPYRGKVKLYGREFSKIPDAQKYGAALGILPQNPQALFVKKTVELDLQEMLKGKLIPIDQQRERIAAIVKLCELEDLLSMHPYDLSGGEQQRVALAKVLLLNPNILILDEPTKGLDAHFKQKLATILKKLRKSGMTIVMVSHDIEFCARYADRCAMFFDGSIVGEDVPRRFFSDKNFYTTAANRMARTLLPDAILAEDIIRACGGTVGLKGYDSDEEIDSWMAMRGQEENGELQGRGRTNVWSENIKAKVVMKTKLTPCRIGISLVGLLLFCLTYFLFANRWQDWRDYLVQLVFVLELAVCLAAIFPGNDLTAPDESIQPPREKRHLSRRTLTAMAMILIAIPLTIYIGIFYLEDRKYYFISALIILEIMLPFAMVFEDRKPQARELMIIAVLCGIGVAGRAAFFMLPQFKPIAAITIIAGVCFGGETGFLTGAVIALVSSIFFKVGPWMPWQMFGFGMIGFLAGVLFRKGFLRKRRSSLCIFGGLATFFIYGGILNPASVLMMQPNPKKEMFLLAYLQGIPFDMIHAAASIFFLWFLSGPMIEKLDRIKRKYGLIDA